MANYIATCRTNYFKVKDSNAFKAALQPIEGIEIVEQPQGFCIIGCYAYTGSWPSEYRDASGENYLEFDIRELIAEHLVDGEVAIFMETGAEKLRYLSGYAEAINASGDTRTVSIDDIYNLATQLTDRPGDITRAES